MTAVIDASALVEALLRGKAAHHVNSLIEHGFAVAPELLDAEIVSTLARMERAKEITGAEGSRALDLLVSLPIERIPLSGLVRDAWQRRGNIAAYDAFYVALASRLGCPLVTADRRLAAAPGLDITITLVQG